MKRKLRRSIYCIVCILTILSVSCIVAFADVPMYSVGGSERGTNFVTGPSILTYQEFFVSWPNDSETFAANYSLQASFPAINNADMVGYEESCITYLYSDNQNEAELNSGISYSLFYYDDLTVRNGFVSGSFHSNCDVYVYTSNDSVWNGVIRFTVRDFYCWPGEFDSSTGYYGTSEVEFDFDPVYDDVFSYMSSTIYYSVNGSDEVIEYYFGPNTSPPAYENLNFGVDPSFLPGVGSNDVVYIHEWNFTVCDSLAFEDGYAGPGYSGKLTYNFNPDVRNIDINAGRNFDSDNPAVPLLDYTAWIGTAVSGFLDLQFFPNFTLGGVLMTLLAFTCVIWFLKLVAGG